ncbi:MAG: hypothetical protein ABL878_10220 [Burkholderiales bacterium]
MQDVTKFELFPEDVPSFKEAWEQIEPFALTFDGVQHWGSAEKSAEVAMAKRMETLAELRTCLYYEARRWASKSPDNLSMRYIRALVYAIREKVSANNVQ